MTDAEIYERVSGIRGELLTLLTDVGSPFHDDQRTGLVQEDLLLLANGLGRIADGLEGARVGPSVFPPSRGANLALVSFPARPGR
jgi:hypothetical protein